MDLGSASRARLLSRAAIGLLDGGEPVLQWLGAPTAAIRRAAVSSSLPVRGGVDHLVPSATTDGQFLQHWPDSHRSQGTVESRGRKPALVHTSYFVCSAGVQDDPGTWGVPGSRKISVGSRCQTGVGILINMGLRSERTR